MDSPQKDGSNIALSQIKNARDETEDKENVRSRWEAKYLGCHTAQNAVKITSCATSVIIASRNLTSKRGLEREEYKVMFHCEELEAASKKKQWIMRNKLIAYSCMTRNVSNVQYL